jgi:organic radical activating enzyme
MVPGVELHEPGLLSRRGVIDVGLKCVHSCRMCFYSFMDGSDDQFAGMRHAKFHSAEHVIGVAESLAANHFTAFDVTGGEPTLSPALVPLIRRATELGLASRVITLGQWLGRPMFGADHILLTKLRLAGLTDLRLSVHEVSEPEFKQSTGGEWARMRVAMALLDADAFQYTTNTTITEANYRRLPQIAAEIAQHNVYNATLLFMMAHYRWAESGHASGVQARYSDAAPYAREFVQILEDAGIAVTVRYAPLCTVAGLEKNHVGFVGVRYDPHEWMNRIDHYADPDKSTPASASAQGMPLDIRQGEPARETWLYKSDEWHAERPIAAYRGPSPDRAVKLFPRACAGCAALPACDGFEPQYLKQHGSGEATPYTGPRREHFLAPERLSYRAAYVYKTAPDGDARSVVRALLSNDPVRQRRLTDVAAPVA